MSGTMAELVLAGLVLIFSHLGISSTPLRAMLVERLGETPYLGVYSLVSLLAFTWLGIAYARAPYVELWAPVAWQFWVPLLAVPPALLLVVGGLSTPNPTAVGANELMTRDEPARGVLRITRNPFLWGVGIWAIAHMVPNGDVASLVLFAMVALLALVGSVLLDLKLALRMGADWGRYAAVTSNLPFQAIARGRQSLVWEEIGWWRLALALVVYAALLYAHQPVFGVSPLPV